MTLPDSPSGENFDRFRPALQRHLGFRLRPDLAQPGDIVMDAPISEDVVGPALSYQGGALATLVDTAGAVCATMHGGGRLVATQDLTVTYLAPGKIGPIRATASLLRAGSTTIVVEVRCTDAGREDERLVAVGLVTCVVIGTVPHRLSEPPPPAQP